MRIFSSYHLFFELPKKYAKTHHLVATHIKSIYLLDIFAWYRVTCRSPFFNQVFQNSFGIVTLSIRIPLKRTFILRTLKNTILVLISH